MLIVGLGNPGSEHAQNRHNVGFWCLNRVARRAGTQFSLGGKLAAVAEGTLASKSVALAKPRTYVNQSGTAVAELLKRYRLQAQDLVVVCDDLDREVGALRIRGSGGHGGHNGLRSIIAAIQSDEFIRIRIGIGRPVVDGLPTRDPEHVAQYVLADPPAAERQRLELAVEMAADAVESLLTNGLERTLGKFNAGGDTTNG
jgi:PTH1 family peptidyl-tRNA hydrolase